MKMNHFLVSNEGRLIFPTFLIVYNHSLVLSKNTKYFFRHFNMLFKVYKNPVSR